MLPATFHCFKMYNLVFPRLEQFVKSVKATALETYDRKIAVGATQNNNQLPENGGTSAIFICLKIAKKLLELHPVSDEEIAGTFILTTLAPFLEELNLNDTY